MKMYWEYKDDVPEEYTAFREVADEKVAHMLLLPQVVDGEVEMTSDEWRVRYADLNRRVHEAASRFRGALRERGLID